MLRNVKRNVAPLSYIDDMKHEPDFVRDTDPKALEVFYDIHRKHLPGRKLDVAFELTDFLFELSRAGVRQRYPSISEREVFLRSTALRVPRDLMIRAYGWDPDAND